MASKHKLPQKKTKEDEPKVEQTNSKHKVRKSAIQPPKNKISKGYRLIEDIRAQPDYKSNVERRDKNMRKYLEEHMATGNPKDILIGSMIMFDYFEPKTKEDLEYYDAMPCTIFFGTFKNEKHEPRVLGWNIHYFPPKIRWHIMDRIFEIFKPYYEKAWNDPISKEVPYVQYKMLIDQMNKAKMPFGVREYIPKLMAHIRPVPVKYWSKIALTEGKFKKMTRTAILNRWRNYIDKYSDSQA